MHEPFSALNVKKRSRKIKQNRRESVMKGFRVLSPYRRELLSNVKSLTNKWWVRRVPAAMLLAAILILNAISTVSGNTRATSGDRFYWV